MAFTDLLGCVAAAGFRPGPVAFLLVPLMGAWTLGILLMARTRIGREAQRHAAAVEREQAAVARATVAHERTRIARELHDIVSHNVSLMIVQSIAADRLLDRDRDRDHDRATAHGLHRTIEETGRATVTELRRLREVLRTDDDADADPSRQPPQPTLGDLPELVESMRSAGLRVEHRSTGEYARLPAGSELAAYRVVQEAFTNTLKHAGPTRSMLSISWQRDPRRLGLRVCDEGRRRDGEPLPGPAAGSVGHGAGLGLVGMTERIAAVGGTLHTGPRPGGGFCVHATIPVTEPLHEGQTNAADPCSAGG